MNENRWHTVYKDDIFIRGFRCHIPNDEILGSIDSFWIEFSNITLFLIYISCDVSLDICWLLISYISQEGNNFPNSKVTIFPFIYSIFGNPYPRGEGNFYLIKEGSIYIYNLEFLCREKVSLISYLFTQPFIYISIN